VIGGVSATFLKVVASFPCFPSATEIVCSLGLESLVARSHECDFPGRRSSSGRHPAALEVQGSSRQIHDRVTARSPER
jgi:hypothetical protein